MITSPSDIKTVLVAGAGAMGQQIGMLFSQHGRRVVIYDLSQEILDAASGKINALLIEEVDAGRINPETRSAILARISFETDLEQAAAAADLVSESVPEDPNLKGSLFGQLHEYCPPHTLFTTNTSTLVPSQFASQTGRPEKLSALHFHYPTNSNRVVDIMPHPGTDTAVVDLLMALMKEMQMIPIYLAREKSSYVFNTLLTALNDAAVSLVGDGYASIEDVDRSWMGVMHTTVGPFGIMDAVSLATLYKINKDWAERTQHPRAIRHVAFLQPYIDAGKTGSLSGEGFYKYPNPAFAEAGFLVSANDEA
jgi:3-hydroxybutyryl-CoA dehydrogenase